MVLCLFRDITDKKVENTGLRYELHFGQFSQKGFVAFLSYGSFQFSKFNYSIEQQKYQGTFKYEEREQIKTCIKD